MPHPRRHARALVLTTLAAAAAAGCAPPAEEDGPLGRAALADDGICNEPATTSIDGYPAYAYCGNFNVYTDDGIHTQSSAAPGWTETEGGFGYQCVEIAVRYFYFKWSVPHGWFFSYATDMCGTHPSDVTITSNPVHGDLAVIKPGCAGADATAGHVLVIDSLQGTQIHGIQQNPAGAFTWPDSCVQCYLHAAANGGAQDPCSTAPSGGYYCGQSPQWAGGTKDVLYLCQNGATASMTPCQYGCEVEPAGTNDQCNPGPPDPCSSAPSGGYYCGQSPQWAGGTKDVLYDCQNGKTVSMTPCPYGCIVEPAGTNDQCMPDPPANGTGGAGGSSTTSSGGGSSTTSGTSGSGGGAGGESGAGGGSGGSSTGHGGSGGHTASGSGGSGGSTQHGSCAVGRTGETGGVAAMLAGLAAAALGLRRRRRT
jgi:hypothetical protein